MKASNSYNEEEMLSGLVLGDEDAFEQIYNYYWDKLYFLAHKHLKSAEASEEIVQDVFLNLWNKRTTLQIRSLPQYLAAMTRYAVYRYLAREQKSSFLSLDELQRKASVGIDEEAVMDDRLLLEMVEKLSARLPEKCRLVFVHNKLMDQPLKQVAKKLNISIKTAEAHLTKSLKIIRGKMGDSFRMFLLL